MKKQKHHYSLRTVYYSLFLTLVALPILLVFFGMVLYSGNSFRKQIITNIETAQEAVIAELSTEMKNLSMRLSHMIYTNHGEILNLAAKTDTDQASERYESEQELNETLLMVTEPVKNIISAGFSMKSGNISYFKEDLDKSWNELREEPWYQLALERNNVITIGSAGTGFRSETHETNGHFYMIAAMAPDLTTDRSQKLEMVFLMQDLDAAVQIKRNNSDYLEGENCLGLSRIVDKAGEVLYEPETIPESFFDERNYTKVRSEIPVYGESWYLESYVSNRDMNQEFMETIWLLSLILVVILLMFLLFSMFFLKNILKPLEAVKQGLRQVEDGNMNVHIRPEGQYEIRQMVHAFNAMVRRMNALITEYEEKVKLTEKSPQLLLRSLLHGEETEEDQQIILQEFFKEPYRVLSICMEGVDGRALSTEKLQKIFHEFEQNPHFASHGVWELEDSGRAVIFYRRAEEGEHHAKTMCEFLQKTAETRYEASLSVCIGDIQYTKDTFMEQAEETEKLLSLSCLYGKAAVITVETQWEKLHRILERSRELRKFAAAIYTSDERRVLKERETFIDRLNILDLEQGKLEVLALIFAVFQEFAQANDRFDAVFGYRVDYMGKIEKLEESQQLCMWTMNYISWLCEYTREIIPNQQTELIEKAKRYIQENYRDPGLSLKKLAEYVELNERYLSTRFTKETGENFQSYLTGLRIEKSKELLQSTQFKVYEIAEMVGYTTPEHFNRMFKKQEEISPAQYRKQKKLYKSKEN